MKVAPIICLSAMLFASPASAAADQFDLICKGTIESFTLSGTETKSFEYSYSVDLAKGKYCEKGCRALFDIAKINPGSLTLSSKRVDTPSEESFSSIVINRETGEFVGNAGTRYPRRPELTSTLQWRGTCEAAPFSGFPELQTKF